ncbi:rap1 GTPase-GDP dissociation stimulator 1 isoform X2 [Contarinia nasturtii]|uniref:rap1 GTPase-GDP dissociation stimulator 1 isoform X2 n=1 Tax=Contarinia nasturtii TaxID=265458 RepID=UPI0012D38E68|nr:rap1 GTPase-GDP dissociation stimulator 1 isoform X2 [Contarinia nasturtii]
MLCVVYYIYGEVDELVESFKTISIQCTNSVELIECLKKIVQAAETNATTYDAINLTDTFLVLLKRNDLDADVREQIDRTIAEITKIDGQRKRFTTNSIIENVLNRLATETKQNTSTEQTKQSLSDTQFMIAIQCCRALGNICYNNEDARNIILKLNGAAVIINLLDLKLDANNELEVTFAKFRGGLISNYLLGGEHLAKNAMELDILRKIENILDDCIERVDTNHSEEILLNTLQPLSLLTENVADLNFSHKLNGQLAKILTISKDPDVAEICLEMLNYQAENDDVKLQLAKDGVCETIYRLLETYKTLANTNEARALMKLACDLIVLILTGDESMHYLYNTSLLKYMEDWLDNSYDIDLLTTGVLALGNFARTDSHCIEMVNRNITTKLLTILSKNNGIDNEMKLQHALLSALRNLVIPKENKSVIIKAGLVETILPMLKIHQAPVVYKLLGTLRMLIDGQPSLAHQLLENTTLIQQLIEWCQSSDCSSVTGESFRLMAWLIKHAYKDTASNIATTSPSPATTTAAESAASNRSSLKAFIKIAGSVQCMVTMLSSQHMVMQNEALIALCIMSSLFIPRASPASIADNDVNLAKILIDCDLGGKLADFIQRNADAMTKEIVENVQTLMAPLRTSDTLIEHLNQHNIDELLKTIPILTEYCTL